jgi:hypothetical protein
VTATVSALDRDTRIIVAAVASGSTQAEAAEVAGCSARTVRRRLADPTVRAALDAERTRVAHEVADALIARARAAVDRLARVVDSGADRDAVAAARVLLSEARGHREATYVADRLREVENALFARRLEESA